MADSSVWRGTGRRIGCALALSGCLGLWPACSSNHRLPDPQSFFVGGGGGAASAGAFGQGGNSGNSGNSTCTTPASCGAGSNHGPDLAVSNAGMSSGSAAGGTSGAAGATGLCQPPALVAAGCVAAQSGGSEALCNGLDDDCDGSIDEGCPCTAGAVQPCFLGPPARHGVGACVDGAQTCMRGVEFAPYWGDCVGGIRPGQEVCDGLDNDCNGCTDDLEGCTPKWTCPGPNDPRTPDGAPLAPYLLHGHDFFSEAGATWSWTVQGGPCDALTPNSPSFTLTGATAKQPPSCPS